MEPPQWICKSGYTVSNPDIVSCTPDELPCNDGTCFHRSMQCNGFPDCYDRSDEANCQRCEGPDLFKCRQSLTCIFNDKRYATCTRTAFITRKTALMDPIVATSKTITRFHHRGWQSSRMAEGWSLPIEDGGSRRAEGWSLPMEDGDPNRRILLEAEGWSLPTGDGGTEAMVGQGCLRRHMVMVDVTTVEETR